MHCLFCDSKKHQTYKCKSPCAEKMERIIFNIMNSNTCPNFSKINTRLLRLMAWNFIFTKSTFPSRIFTIYHKKQTKNFDILEKLPNNKLEKKKQKYCNKYGLDIISHLLPKQQLVAALKKRWTLYYDSIIKYKKQVNNDINPLEKCNICFDSNVKMICWNNLTCHKFYTYVEQTDKKPPAKCSICSLICCNDCLNKWYDNNPTCPQCRTPYSFKIPKDVYNENTNKFLDYKCKDNEFIEHSYWNNFEKSSYSISLINFEKKLELHNN